jgi:hypothetical protein
MRDDASSFLLGLLGAILLRGADSKRGNGGVRLLPQTIRI